VLYNNDDGKYDPTLPTNVVLKEPEFSNFQKKIEISKQTKNVEIKKKWKILKFRILVFASGFLQRFINLIVKFISTFSPLTGKIAPWFFDHTHTTGKKMKF